MCAGGGGVRLSSNLVADFSNIDRLHSVSNQQRSVEGLGASDYHRTPQDSPRTPQDSPSIP